MVRVDFVGQLIDYGVFSMLFEEWIDSHGRAFERMFRALATTLGIFVRTRLCQRIFIHESFTSYYSKCFVLCYLADIMHESIDGERYGLLGQSMHTCIGLACLLQ